MQTQSIDLAEFRSQFDKDGFVIIPDALSKMEVARLNAEVDRHLANYPQEWVDLSDSLKQCVAVLSHSLEFDFTIENRRILPVLEALIGPQLSFEEIGLMIRNPTANLDEIKGWHRDLTRDYSRRREIDAISVVYYLTDVTSADHCFSIVPETHNRRIDLRPGEVKPGDEVDVLGPAGTALIFHARCIHNGKLKPRSRQRRTLHIYYSHADGPRTSEWTEIPPRLYQKSNSSLPAQLYSKWNCRKIFDGTGKKPDSLDRTLPVGEQIRIVQRMAKLQNQKT